MTLTESLNKGKTNYENILHRFSVFTMSHDAHSCGVICGSIVLYVALLLIRQDLHIIICVDNFAVKYVFKNVQKEFMKQNCPWRLNFQKG